MAVDVTPFIQVVAGALATVAGFIGGVFIRRRMGKKRRDPEAEKHMQDIHERILELHGQVFDLADNEEDR